MPKGKKGKNKRKSTEEDTFEVEDWDKVSDNEEMDARQLRKLAKKQKRKNKRQNRNKFPGDDENEFEIAGEEAEQQPQQQQKGKKGKKGRQQQSQETSDDDIFSEEPAVEPQLTAKQRKKLRKKNKKANRMVAEEEEDFDFDGGDGEEDDNQWNNQKKGKQGKKGKKGKGNKGNQHNNNFELDDVSDDDLFGSSSKKNNKKGKKNKKNNKYQQQQQQQTQQNQKKGKKKGKKKAKPKSWESIRESKQEQLLAAGNAFLANTDAKYAPYISEDYAELWNESISEVIIAFGEEPNENLENEEVFKGYISTLRETWKTIFVDIADAYRQAAAVRAENAKERDRELKMAKLGIKVGANRGNRNQNSKQKRTQKKRMKDLAAILAKKDAEQMAIEVEAAKAAEKERVRLEAERKKAARSQAAAEKKARLKAEAEANADWSDGFGDGEEEEEESDMSSSESDASSDDNNRQNNKKKKNSKKNNKRNNGRQGPRKRQKYKRNAQTALDSDSDDDANHRIAQRKRELKQRQNQPKPNKPKKKTRGGRRRNRKKGNATQEGADENASANAASVAVATAAAAGDEAKEETKDETKEKEEAKEGMPTESKTNDEPGASSKRTRHSNRNKHSAQKPLIQESEEQKDTIHLADSGGKKKGKKKKKNKELRSPICVVMGHVDTGKTKILDHIRNTSVQKKEAGGITQQIGATYLSIQYIKDRTSRLKEQVNKLKYKVPGLLFIDTPGHEAFSNLRSRGSSMCDIAVVVVDLMHGIEPQTEESLKMLKAGGTPFVVALNKIDLCLDWEPDAGAPFLTTYAKQAKHTQSDFENRLKGTKLDFATRGFNAELYSRNKRMDTDISLVPTSAHTGEGIPDLLYLIVTLTKRYMSNVISKGKPDFKASVLEVKKLEGFGACIDVIISNGTLRDDDTILVCGMNGPIMTRIRALLLPHEAQEMRVKGEYQQVSEVEASAGVRIAAVEDLSSACAGSSLIVLPRHLKHGKYAKQRAEVVEQLKDEVQAAFADLFQKIDRHSAGVHVQASTLGSLEALIEFLHTQKIPVSGIGIGDIHKKHVMKAGTLAERQPEYACILAFNVRIQADAREEAARKNVRIFEAEIIYHLQDMFEEYINGIREQKKGELKGVAVFPVEMVILSESHVFNNKNPIVVGVNVTRGTLRMRTPIVAQRWNSAGIAMPLYLGRVTGIKVDDVDAKMAKMGTKCSVKIGTEQPTGIQVGRSFSINDPLISEISSESIAALKESFEDEIRNDKETISHLIKLKKYFNIIHRGASASSNSNSGQ